MLASKLAIAGSLMLMTSHGIAAEPAWKPDKNVEIVIAAAAAGANDRIGRAIQRVLQETKLVPTTVSVVNKPGGGQNIAVAYLNSHAGDPHHLMLASASWFTTVAGGAMMWIGRYVPWLNGMSAPPRRWNAAL